MTIKNVAEAADQSSVGANETLKAATELANMANNLLRGSKR